MPYQELWAIPFGLFPVNPDLMPGCVILFQTLSLLSYTPQTHRQASFSKKPSLLLKPLFLTRSEPGHLRVFQEVLFLMSCLLSSAETTQSARAGVRCKAEPHASINITSYIQL